MKKYLIGGAIVLQLLNNEIFSWIALAVVAAVVLAKIFPDLMEGTK
jgi:hypothetical protein